MSKTSLALTLTGLLLSLTGCAQTQTTTVTTSADVVTEPTPILYNLGGVDLAGIEFNQYRLDPEQGQVASVYLFGQPLPQHSPDEPLRINPNLEFGGLTEPIDIISATDGVVGFIRQQSDSADYEVFIMPSTDSAWTIGYDHLTDIQVEQNQIVTAGTVLGKAAVTNQGDYRYELQINQDANGTTTMYCPTDLLDPSVKTDWQVALDAFISNWNTDYEAIYGELAYPEQTGGCVQPTVTLAESEGL